MSLGNLQAKLKFYKKERRSGKKTTTKHFQHRRYGEKGGRLVGEWSIKDSTEMKRKLMEIYLLTGCPGV